MLPTFREFNQILKGIEESFNENADGTIEGFFEKVEEKGLCLETVMTGDIAQVTKPLGMLRRRSPLPEFTPTDPEIEKWIQANKNAYKKRYGDEWETILHSTAWAMYNKK